MNTQQAFTCSKSTIKTLELCLKSAQPIKPSSLTLLTESTVETLELCLKSAQSIKPSSLTLLTDKMTKGLKFLA